MALELNSSKQPFVKINSPKYNLKFPFERNFDLTDLMLFTKGDEPYQHFANLRNNAPVYFHETGPEDSEPGFWVLTKYKDIEFVSKNQEIFSSQLAGGTALTHGFEQQDDLPLYRSTMDHMLSLDGMLHLSMRNPHMAFFNPKYVSNLRKKVELKVDQLLDQIAPLGRCNLVETVSAEVPMFTLCEMLGVPEEDRPKIIEWMKFLEMAQLIAATQAAEKGDIEFSEEHTQAAPDPALVEMFTNMVAEMFDYGRTILESRRKDPKDDLLSVIANIEVEGEKLPNEYLDGSWLLIIFAGNDTTRNSISGTMNLLSENPDQKNLVLNDKSLLPNMVHESIRMVSPVRYMRRTTKCDTQIGDQEIGPNEKVSLWYGAANRDPEIFTNPDKFDVTRENAKKHLAFGYGRHLCLGKHTANMQLEVVYEKIFSRFPEMEQDGEMILTPNNFVNAIQDVPVKFNPEK
ncbi:cytochrome P450 [SAR86 cluster bacterium]|jgi:cytochrome P450|nr:cytochrome P450 [SAR86 cluster bacterium]